MRHGYKLKIQRVIYIILYIMKKQKYTLTNYYSYQFIN